MGTIAGNTRAVFDRFRATFDKTGGRSDWRLTFKDDDEVLTWVETKAALDLLISQGLIARDADEKYRLTEIGVDVCLDAEAFYDYVPRPTR